MTCKDFIEFLHEYLGGELPQAQKQLFEDHLAICESCVSYLSNYEDTMSLTKACFSDDAPVPEGVPEELVLAILAARKASHWQADEKRAACASGASPARMGRRHAEPAGVGPRRLKH